jgi:hypothetical protein
MVGGLFSATLLTLVVLPAAYMLAQRVQLRGEWGDAAPVGASGHGSMPEKGTASHDSSAISQNA